MIDKFEASISLSSLVENILDNKPFVFSTMMHKKWILLLDKIVSRSRVVKTKTSLDDKLVCLADAGESDLTKRLRFKNKFIDNLGKQKVNRMVQVGEFRDAEDRWA